MPTPYDVCNGGTGAAGNTLTLTVGTGIVGDETGTAAGDLVYVTARGLSNLPTGVTDSQGNSYFLCKASSVNANNIAIFASFTQTALTTNVDTITVSYAAGTGAKIAIARGCPGVSSVLVDVTRAASGSSTAPSSGSSGALSQAAELVVGAVANAAAGGAPTGAPSFGAYLTVQSTQYLTGFDEIVSSTAGQTASATLGTTSTWAALIVTFRLGPGATAPAAPLALAAPAGTVRADAVIAGPAAAGLALAAPAGTVTTGATAAGVAAGLALAAPAGSVTVAAPPFPQGILDLRAAISLRTPVTPILFGTISSQWANLTGAGVTGLSFALCYNAYTAGTLAGQSFTISGGLFVVSGSTVPLNAVVVLSGLSGVSGFTAGTTYYVVSVASGNKVSLSSSFGGAPITPGSGSGTLTRYTGIPASWPGTGAGTPFPGGVQIQVADFSPVIAEVLAGTIDTQISTFFAGAPPGSWIMPMHEANAPSSLTAFNATGPNVQAMDAHLIALKNAVNPTCLYGRGFATFPVYANGQDPTPWVTPNLDFYGMDGYQGTTASRTPASVFGGTLAAIRAVQPSAKVAIIETGTSLDVTAWFNAIQAWAIASGMFAVESSWGIGGPGSQAWQNSFAPEMNTLSSAFAAPGASSTWADITPYVYQRKSPAVTITRGRPNQSSSVTPATAACEISNRGGQFTAQNPAGPWYGQLGRNTPIRFSVPSQTPYLRLEGDSSSQAWAPGAAPLNITGDIDIRADLTLTDHTPGVIASKGTAAWSLALNANGTLTFAWTDSGSAAHSAVSTQPLPFLGRVMIRVTLSVSAGIVTFYTAPTMGGTQAQLGAAVTAGATSIASSATQLAVGDYGPDTGAAATSGGVNGAVWEFRLYSGIGGTLVANPVFTAQAEGTAPFADAQGNLWTMGGTSEISQRSYRFHGEMSATPKATDPSLTDVYVPLAAGGLLRRLQQGNAPLYSPVRRAVQAQAGTLYPVAYWPMEDPSGSTSLGSVTGGPAMVFSGGTPNLASDSSFPGSAAVPVLNGAELIGSIAAYTGSGSIVVRFLMHVPLATTTPDASVICRVLTTGKVRELTLRYKTAGHLELTGWDTGGNNLFGSGTVAFGVAGELLWVSMELRPVSGITWSVTTMQPGATSGLSSSGTISGTVGNAQQIQLNPNRNNTDTSTGHVSVQSDWVSLFTLTQPLSGWTGEAAGSRFARLCTENGLASRVYGFPSVSAAMGAQAIDTLPNLLQACEDADKGMIYEPRQAYALGYRTLASMTSQAPAVTLDWAQAHLASAKFVPPTDDDLYTINDVTATRSSGSATGTSYRAVLADGSAMSTSPPPVGAGDYATTLSANLAADTQLPDLAGWAVHLGTVPGARYPAIPVDLARAETAGLFWQLQEVNIGDYIRQVNPPSWLTPGDIRQLAAGVTEELGGYDWRLTWNGVPEVPYETAISDDPVYGHADTDGSVLTAGITASATSMQVTTTGPSGLPWTTNAADFPFDVMMGGEQVTVTNITGTTSPQSFTIVRSVNGVVDDHIAGEDVRLAFPAVAAMT